MGGKFEQLGELLDEFIELPVPIGDRKEGNTKLYQIESPSGRDGLRIEKITQLAASLAMGGENIDTEMLDDDEEKDVFKLLLGDKYQQMLEDGVKWVWLRHSALTCLMWVNGGLPSAEQYWAAAGDPERLARNRQERRSKQKASSAAETSTRGRASMNGTSHGQGGSSNGNRRRQGTRRSRGNPSSKNGA